MFPPLVICSKPNAKRRDFICGKWVDVPTEAVYVGSIEAKEPKMIVDTLAIAHRNRFQCRNRKSRLVVEASVRNKMALARICLRMGQPEGVHRYLSEARFALKIMAQYSARLERLP